MSKIDHKRYVLPTLLVRIQKLKNEQGRPRNTSRDFTVDLTFQINISLPHN